MTARYVVVSLARPNNAHAVGDLRLESIGVDVREVPQRER
jgi:uncharacterized caspase-like protein